MPNYQMNLSEGEYILNLPNGKLQHFKPMQIDLHAPSEHTIEGRQYDLEMQIVHHYKGTDSHLGAIISIFFDTIKGVNDNNSFLESVFNLLDQEGDKAAGQIDIQDFLQAVDFSEYWSYEGSTTLPPCEEGIKWTIINDIQKITPNQLKRITDQLAGDPDFANGNGNNRAIQPINDREIFHTLASTTLVNMVVFVALTALYFH